MTGQTAPVSAALAVDTYQALWWRRLLLLGLAMACLLASFIVDVATGPAFLPLRAVLASVLGHGSDRAVDAIVWSIRLPVALMAVLIGAALGLTGAIMQTILNNPLASSYTLGVSAGAGFGAALVIVLGAGWIGSDEIAIPVSAFVFACIACAGVWLIGSMRGATAETLVLAGIAMMFLFQALLALLQFVASQEALQQVVFWLFGSLQKASWKNLPIMAIVLLLVVPVLARDAWKLTALKLGDERAAGLGVAVTALRLRSFALISVLTGTAVAFVGTIGFIGLVAPHLARMCVGEDQRVFLPASALTGALLLSVASILSKLVLPGTIIPIGIITALIGVPFFVWLVIASRRRFW